MWQVWQQWKVFHERPSRTYGIRDDLAAFIFDRGIYLWASYVERKMDEAEDNIRRSMKNRKGTETFVNSQRRATFNKLLGIKETTNVYKQPQLIKPTQVSGEGDIDLKSLNS